MVKLLLHSILKGVKKLFGRVSGWADEDFVMIGSKDKSQAFYQAEDGLPIRVHLGRRSAPRAEKEFIDEEMELLEGWFRLKVKPHLAPQTVEAIRATIIDRRTGQPLYPRSKPPDPWPEQPGGFTWIVVCWGKAVMASLVILMVGRWMGSELAAFYRPIQSQSQQVMTCGRGLVLDVPVIRMER